MTGDEVLHQIQGQRTIGHVFIKWWLKEKDFVDFELIDRFIERFRPDTVIDGFALLDLEEMWAVLTGLDPDKLARVKGGEGEVIEWTWTGKDGAEKKSVFPFTAEGIMTIISDELFA